jgi:hypothetical protein
MTCGKECPTRVNLPGLTPPLASRMKRAQGGERGARPPSLWGFVRPPEVYAVWQPRRTTAEAPQLYRGGDSGVVKALVFGWAYEREGQQAKKETEKEQKQKRIEKKNEEKRRKRKRKEKARQQARGEGRYLKTRQFFRRLAEQDPCLEEDPAAPAPPVEGVLPPFGNPLQIRKISAMGARQGFAAVGGGVPSCAFLEN